jgi:hypothetical protein
MSAHAMPSPGPGGRLVLLAALSVAAASGCGQREAATAPKRSAQTDQQAIDAATATERKYLEALPKGDLAYLAPCANGSPEFIRLVEVSQGSAQGYSLAITADARGAVAIWQGLQRAADGTWQPTGHQGMRLDVNGWRQLRQMLVELELDDHVRPDAMTLPKGPGEGRFFAYCLEGRPHLGTQRLVDDHGADALAVRMRRLAGNAYSPPPRE